MYVRLAKTVERELTGVVNQIPPELRSILSDVVERPIIFTAQSKQYFYCRDAICEFTFGRGGVPLNPFRVFGYFLDDRVHRSDVRIGNNNLIRAADELWVFGDTIANGVLFEVLYARELGHPIRFFSVAPSAEEIGELQLTRLKFEPELRRLGLTQTELLQLISGEWRPSEELEPRLFDPDTPAAPPDRTLEDSA